MTREDRGQDLKWMRTQSMWLGRQVLVLLPEINLSVGVVAYILECYYCCPDITGLADPTSSFYLLGFYES